MTLEQRLLQQFNRLPHVKQTEVLDFIQFLVQQKPSNEATTLPKRLGLLKGKLTVADDFDAPLPEEILKTFYADLP
jgi:hypothetical protein